MTLRSTFFAGLMASIGIAAQRSLEPVHVRLVCVEEDKEILALPPGKCGAA